MIEKPKIIVDYNEYIGRVDLSGNCLSFYSSGRKRLKKYYVKIFHHFLNITTFNCYQIN